MPGAIGEYFLRLFSNSTTMFMAGLAAHVFRIPVARNSSFGSVMRSKALGSERRRGSAVFLACFGTRTVEIH